MLSTAVLAADMRRPALLLTVLLTLATPADAMPSIPSTSHYVPMPDGTRLAADVYLPPERAADETVPALLVLTRYWRAAEDRETGELVSGLSPLDRFFVERGYALVKVDVRGSGASFGSRPAEYGPQEVKDGYAVVDWVVGRPWSNGKVGAYGTSYTGTTAELLTAVGHPAVRAVIPGWSDFDDYASPVRPYGLTASDFLREWSDFVVELDGGATADGAAVRRVDGDDEGFLRALAVKQHAGNADPYASVAASPFRDDELSRGVGYRDTAPLAWKDEISASGVPMLVLVSWLDAGTADGALLRLRHFANPQKVVILASSHGGREHASPYVVGSEPLPPVPSWEEQARLRLAFFDHHLKGVDNGVPAWPAVRWFVLGEERFRESAGWPPEGTVERSFYLAADHRLAPRPPQSGDGEDSYRVDFTVSTGSRNRWMTQTAAPVLGLDDRAAMDERMLTYTSAPLERDLLVAGRPVVTLHLSSDHTDGAVLAYLEDVAPDGRSRYLTEGGLRLIHRRQVPNPHFPGEEPYHSFARADARPMVPGEVTEVAFRMWPIAARVEAGHRLRLALAGADADSFDRLPASGAPTLVVQRRTGAASRLVLPVVEENY